MKRKTCKECKSPFICYNTIQNLCSECMIAKHKQKPLKAYKSLNKVSKTNKNTPAKFSKQTKAEILDRDKVCIICWDTWTQFHHIYFWANSNRKENRNDLDQWVLLCEQDHFEIHQWVEWKGRLYRAKCIEYILKLK